MAKSLEKIAEETRETRRQIQELVGQGKTEDQARHSVLTGDPNSKRNLERWKEQGLFPYPSEFDSPETLTDASGHKSTRRRTGTSVQALAKKISGKSVPSESQARSIPVLPMTHSEIRDLIRTEVKLEIGRLLEGIEIGSSTRGRAGVKKSFSFPKDLWDEFEKLGGVASNNVAAALRLYLNMRKPSQD